MDERGDIVEACPDRNVANRSLRLIIAPADVAHLTEGMNALALPPAVAYMPQALTLPPIISESPQAFFHGILSLRCASAILLWLVGACGGWACSR